MSAQFNIGGFTTGIVKVGVAVVIFLMVAAVLIQAFAGVGQNIAASFPVTKDNSTVYRIYDAGGSAIQAGANFAKPVITIGMAFLVIIVLVYLARHAGT